MFYITIPHSFLVNERTFACFSADSSKGSASHPRYQTPLLSWKKRLRTFLQKLANNRRRAIATVVDTLLP